MTEKADKLVPEHIWRVTMHYHDLIYIKAFWESIGQVAPTSFTQELERTHQRLLEALDDERGQGGAFHEPKGKLE